MKKRNEDLAYVAISGNYMVIVEISYNGRKKIKERTKELLETRLGEGKKRNLSWNSIYKKEVDIYFELMLALIEEAKSVEVKQVKDFTGGVVDSFLTYAGDNNNSVERIYSAELKLVQIANSRAKELDLKEVYFSRLSESIVGQLASLIAGVHSYTDRYFELSEEEGSNKPGKFLLTDLFLAEKIDKIKY